MHRRLAHTILQPGPTFMLVTVGTFQPLQPLRFVYKEFFTCSLSPWSSGWGSLSARCLPQRPLRVRSLRAHSTGRCVARLFLCLLVCFVLRAPSVAKPAAAGTNAAAQAGCAARRLGAPEQGAGLVVQWARSTWTPSASLTGRAMGKRCTIISLVAQVERHLWIDR